MEKLVLRHTVEGRGVMATAVATGRGIESVKSHRRGILRKTGAFNMPHAVAIAFREGLVE